ncbi:peroxisomal carnitine O-octanoyltransferase-like [Oppia nitens]|uniref:peroxisomal carnitine O-octanoyltransferase-like n=1 Tax=Oppia nitens TaxID=1686743 RepID=UPI0023D9C2AD|nr:peroxisomal carnitine O-octanoyltransferase-like [Oppia nitens]
MDNKTTTKNNANKNNNNWRQRLVSGILQYLPESLTSRVIGRDAIFKSTTNKTFENEDKLPALPVPSLKTSLELYLETVRPVATDDEYARTETIVRNFENGIGNDLQQMLMKRAESSKNWLELWWEDVAYLQNRLPLIPFSNMTGSLPNYDYWPVQTGTRLERLALLIYFHLQFWQLLRKEQLKPVLNKSGQPLAMNQFHRVFNTCRIPGKHKDSLIENFKTESEGGSSPNNIILLYKGHIFSFDLVQNDQLLTAPEIEHQLKHIENWCQQNGTTGSGIGSLTTTDRTKWADNRDYLIKLNKDNEDILNTIENSMFVVALDDNQPIGQEEILREALLGSGCENRWADKSFTNIAYVNGNFAANLDHTPFDGLAIATEAQYVLMSLSECKGVYNGPKTKRTLPEPLLLEFKIDDKIVNEIEIAKYAHRQMCDSIEITYKVFTEYGRSVSAKHQIHPEAYIQVAVQLAYYRIHGKAAPTYCTATTRKFYRGRTETCRPCVSETVDFARAVTEGNKDDSELYEILIKSGKKFQQTMASATNGAGCDRHLLGLYLTALENGMQVPDLYTDPMYVKSGGNGNFVLSSSCVGYLNICGSVPPMVENGYSFFYGIESHQYSFTISSYKSCPETSAVRLQQELHEALMDMKRIVDSQQTQ